ncbi:excinuclease ABC subunit UvrB [Candidatus Roizmanbacteria bacterium]|nr:excinuclease ABC subunit UvrB [Candidatus Roizmanbacteria bacterium]
MFQLKSSFKPTGDQPQAINKLAGGITSGLKNQVLLGVTGSGKTFTMANIIQKLQMPALIISHNKTLAGQLYQEMRDFFPENGVSYFVSYYDFYQPEAYIPTTDTYIEKEAQINDLIDKLRLRASTNIMTRTDAIVVASVSCIYNIGSPVEYRKFILELRVGQIGDFGSIVKRLVQLLYERSEFEFKRGTFRLRGNYMDIYPAYEDYGYRIYLKNQIIDKLVTFEPLTGKEVDDQGSKITNQVIIYPAKHYLTDPEVFKSTEQQIRDDLKKEHAELLKKNRIPEAERLLRRVNYDLEMIKEVGYVNGIENYSRYFDKRKAGDPPHSLLDYFKEAYGDKFLVFIDESHMTVPQLRGMFNGDYSRKKTLIDYGFRLKAAFDNRPLKFEEFYRIPQYFVYFSATPNEWEIEKAGAGIAEQLIRPTGIIDPEVEIRPAKTEVQDLIKEVVKRVINKERILVTTLTKKNAEDLSDYLKERNIRAAYLHSDIKTLERSNVLDNLRKNEFDVLIGVNLLREGLDLPEITLVAILDADKEGFLRSKTSLIQTMGRAARNIAGSIIMYADDVTGSMKQAITEIDRRRKHQLEYNKKHHITPKNIYKPIREKIIVGETLDQMILDKRSSVSHVQEYLNSLHSDSLTPYDRKKVIKRLENEMKRQAEDLNFELAIEIRDKVRKLIKN